MRGDSGALPRLTIELTDSGYRAIDPELKVRYVVTEAPPGMPVTDGARTLLSTNPPPVQSAPPPPAPNPVPTLASPPAPAGAEANAATLATTAPTAPAASPAPAAAPLVSAPAAATNTTPMTASVSAASAASESTVASPPATSAKSATYGGSFAPAAAPTSSFPPPSVPTPPPLSVQVIRQREEKPTAASPIAYRELALAVRAGTAKSDVEGVLRARLEEVSATMPADARRFVQIAVFDHVFVKRPVRPPLGTLVWKDWRGDPTLAFPGFGETDEGPPPSSISTARTPSWSATQSMPPRADSLPPPAVASVAVPVAPAPPAPPAASVPPPAASSAEIRPGSVLPSRVVSVGPSKPAPAENATRAAAAPVEDAPLVSAPAENVAPVAAPAAESTPLVGAAAAPSTPPAAQPPSAAAAPVEAAASPLVVTPGGETAPNAAGASVRRSDPALRRSDPALRRSDPGRRSDPSIVPPRRRAPGEDLITELFDRMGELMFMGDIPSGADYVLNVLFDLIPCEAMLVHVFDLARREFVVVRAHGPKMRNALLFRTPDTDPAVADVMRQRSVVANGAAPIHSGAFDRLGVHAKQILSGAARQGGRYLGLIELANPSGGAPFHEGEKHALEYVCEQFAAFVASHPLVLDEDIVLRA